MKAPPQILAVFTTSATLAALFCVRAPVLAAAPAEKPSATTRPADASSANADPHEQHVVYRVTGLFMPEREADLRKTVEKIPGVTVISVNFDHGEATFAFDPKTAFPDTKPDKILERFDQLLKKASRSTFGVKPVCTIPRDKLKLVEFPIQGLDCKACSLFVYETLAKEEGVEQATASFKDGLATALIDPEKTSREKLEAVLKKREIPLKKP